MMSTMTELTLSDASVGEATCLKNPMMDEKGVMLVLGNNQLAFAKGRSPTEIGKSELPLDTRIGGSCHVIKYTESAARVHLAESIR